MFRVFLITNREKFPHGWLCRYDPVEETMHNISLDSELARKGFSKYLFETKSEAMLHLVHSQFHMPHIVTSWIETKVAEVWIPCSAIDCVEEMK